MYVYKGVSVSHEKEWDLVICGNIDGPRTYYVKWNKSEKDKCHVISPISGIKKKKEQTHKYGKQIDGCQSGG